MNWAAIRPGIKIIGVTLILIAIVLGFSSLGIGQTQETSTPQPQQSSNDAKWRIGYVEGEPYVNFAGTFYYLIQGLEELGWLNNTNRLPYEQGQEDSYHMWQWLVENDTGPYLEFVADAHYSLSDPEVNEVELFKRLEQGDLDLIVVMGTRAGRDMIGVEHQVPVMVFSASNAVQSGIIQSELDSGRDNVWAHMDSDRFRRQIEVFHDIFEFSSLGMVYEDSPVGRVYAAVSDVEEVAQDYGFQLVREFVDELNINEDNDRDRYYGEVLAANRRLAEQVEAMYITVGNWELDYLPALLEPFYEKNIPVFSQQGSNEVKHGALMSLYRADFSGIGRFGADTIMKVLQGESPRYLPQIYGDTPSIVINLKAAELVGYQVPFEILLVADEIFLDIGNNK